MEKTVEQQKSDQKYYQQEYQKFIDGSAGQAPLWWRKDSLESSKRFALRGFPDKKEELWRYTPLQKFLEQTSFSLFKETSLPVLSAEQEKKLQQSFLPEKSRIVFINGLFSPQYSKLLDGPSVTVKNLSDLLKSPEESQGIREILNFPFVSEQDSYRDSYENSFLDLGRAFCHQGLSIKVAGDAQTQLVLQIISVTTEDFSGHMHHPRYCVQVGRYSQLTLLEGHLHLQDGRPTKSLPYLTNTCSDFFLAEGAKATHIKMQKEDLSAGVHIGHTRAHLKRDAQFQSFSFQLGAALSRHHIAIILSEPGANCRADGLYTLRESQHGENYTFIDHAAANTQALQLYKGIMTDTSHGVFHGRMLVRPGAQQINSHQLNKNLLMTKKAQIHTHPQLEIYADDVKCGHGATIGQINQDELFYLQTRGIPPARAQKMLAHAFAHDALLKIDSLEMRDLLNRQLEEDFERRAGISIDEKSPLNLEPGNEQ